MAEIVAENSYLVSEKKRMNYCDQDKMIVIQTNLQAKDEEVD